MVNFVGPGPAGGREQGDNFSPRGDAPLMALHQAALGGQALSPRPAGSRDRDNKALQRLRNRPAAASQSMDRGDLLRLSQSAQLTHVANIPAKSVDERKDVCPECSSDSFKDMVLDISPLRAEQDGMSATTYARYYSDTNTAMVYQQFFELHFVMQASTLFHEYAHSLEGNKSMIRNATPEESRRAHPDRPWEVDAIRLERIFQERFGQRLVKDRK